MLFTTGQFALIFLPLTLTGFFAIGAWSPIGAAAWLFAASLFFYGYWMPVFTLLLAGSIVVNFLIGTRIAHTAGTATAGRWMIAGVAANLAALAYFKYANFVVDNLGLVLGVQWDIGRVILPIGISFYTFTQIAFLVDTWRGKVREYRFIHYGLFVTYFPHLVAGPVLHHAQMMPQFGDRSIYRFDGARFASGLAVFGIGLVKKVVLADGIAPYADAVFRPADHLGLTPDALEAWLGALAYTLQLYFDFSGYSDMAIGLSRMFNVRLPFNFDSPYRSTSITEFWRRWHISLSAFLRDYLYIALGGNRHGVARRYANLMITMLLGGLWHGASWSFVLWGGLHGAYLTLNHAFRAACGVRLCERLDRSRAFGLVAWLLTMLAVVVAWVLFRAETLSGALRVLHGMAGVLDGGSAINSLLWNAGLHADVGALWCAALGAMACLGPNSNQIGLQIEEALRGDAWRRGLLGATAAGCVALMLLINATRDAFSAFIYFNF